MIISIMILKPLEINIPRYYIQSATSKLHYVNVWEVVKTTVSRHSLNHIIVSFVFEQ